MNYIIYGKHVSFSIANKRIKNILEEELSIYKKPESQDVDAKIHLVNKIQVDGNQFISPSIHVTTRHGFLADYGACKVLYMYKYNRLNIIIEIPSQGLLSKLLSYDFRTNADVVGTLLHEFALVPMTYFFKDLAIVHSSAFKNNITGETYMIGGTGGVGKTTLELLYCKKEHYSFIADDISVVAEDGYIHPNLSYPKIYAYNTISDKKFEQSILSGDSLSEKAHWYLIKNIRGDSKVRRRVCPEKLYGKVENDKTLITNYFILLKNNLNDQITVKKANTDSINKITLSIISNEYHVFHQHIIWHENNCLANKLTPIIKIDDVYSAQEKIITSCFKNVKSYFIYIPNKMGHLDFKNKIEEYIG